MTLFDLFAALVVLVSVLVGFTNGAVREIVGVFAFVLAALFAVVILPVTGPLMRQAMAHSAPVWTANAAAIITAFVIAYIALKLAGHWITVRLRSVAALGTLDRIAGGGVGLLRGLVLMGGFFLIYNAATPVELRPPWIEKAALLPLARTSGQTLQRLTPKGLAAAGRMGPSLKAAVGGDGAGVELGADAPTTETSGRNSAGEPRRGLQVEGGRSKPRAKATSDGGRNVQDRSGERTR